MALHWITLGLVGRHLDSYPVLDMVGNTSINWSLVVVDLSLSFIRAA